jgi:proliferating cell nuclear antigen
VIYFAGEMSFGVEASLGDGLVLRKTVEALQGLLEEVTFRWSREDGLTLHEMDSAHVALVSLRLPPAMWKELVLPPGVRSVPMSLTLATLRDRLRLQKKEGPVSFAMPADGRGDLSLKLWQGEVASQFSIRLLDIDGDVLSVPDAPYDATIVMSSADFQRIMTELQVFGDVVQIVATQDALRLVLPQSGAIDATIVLKATKPTKPPTTKLSDTKHSDTKYCDTKYTEQLLPPPPGSGKAVPPAKSLAPKSQWNEAKVVTKGSDSKTPKGGDSKAATSAAVMAANRALAAKTAAARQKKKPAAGTASMTRTVEMDAEDEQLMMPPAGSATNRCVEIALREGVEQCSHDFALRYLEKFGKAAALSPTVRLRLCRDMPLIVEFDLPHRGSLSFFLAPKLEDHQPEA